MRCYICDCIIPDEHVKVDPATKKIGPCLLCLEIIYDTIHSDGLDHGLDDWCVPVEDDGET